MKITYRKKFLKELAKVPRATRTKMEAFVFEELPAANSIFETGSAEQMKGYPTYFKIRFGAYRIGFKMENDTVILEKALHRNDIYRHFP